MSQTPLGLPPMALNLLRKKKQQYRLRRRLYLKHIVEEAKEPTPSPRAAATPAPAAATPVGPSEQELALKREVAAMQFRLQQAEKQLAGFTDLREKAQHLETALATATTALEDKTRAFEEAKRVVEEAKSQVLKSRAEMDTQRKRLAREKEDAQKFAAEDLLRQLFPSVDHFGIALDSVSQGAPTETFLQGIGMVYKELVQTLAAAGLSQIETVGKPFDPAVHDAVAAEEDLTKPDGVVLKMMRSGYVLKGKIIRPAMVVVNKNHNRTPAPAPALGERTPPPMAPGVGPVPLTPKEE